MHRDSIEPRISSDISSISPKGGSTGKSSVDRTVKAASIEIKDLRSLVNSLLRRIERLENQEEEFIRNNKKVEYGLKNGYIPYYNGADLADSPILNDVWEILVYKRLFVKGYFKAENYFGPIFVRGGSIMLEGGNAYGWAGNRERITGSAYEHNIKFYVDALLRAWIDSSGYFYLNYVANADEDVDKFLVLDSYNRVKYRTGAQLLSDLETEVVIDYDDPIDIDVSLGSVFHVTLEGDPDISAPTNAVAGKKIVIRLEQDDTGGRVVTWNAVFRFSTDLPEPTLSSDPNTIDYYGFIYNGVDEKWDLVGQVQGF